MSQTPTSKSATDLENELKKTKSKLKRTKHELAHVQAHASEGHEDGESNWLVAYADMMTLLFGFFVILSAFSTPNAEKVEEMRRETSKAMGGKYVKPYQELSEGLHKTLQEINLDKEVTIVETDEGVTLTSRGALFFESGSAILRPQASTFMEKITTVLAKEAKGFKIVVEGHTDNVPMASKDFPSNWELSSTRAGTVVRLLESKGIAKENLQPIGLADIEPIVPNVDPNGLPNETNQALNRRIVLKILKQHPKRL